MRKQTTTYKIYKNNYDINQLNFERNSRYFRVPITYKLSYYSFYKFPDPDTMLIVFSSKYNFLIITTRPSCCTCLLLYNRIKLMST